MKKSFNALKLVLIAFLCLPAAMWAQYNNTYKFATDYEPSKHLCATQLENQTIIEGGTVYDNYSNDRVVELGLIMNNGFGTMTPSPVYYQVGGADHMAVDLVECNVDKNDVIVVANIFANGSTPANTISVFRTDSKGNVKWAKVLGTPYEDMRASAITTDGLNHYVYGHMTRPNERFLYLAKIDEWGNMIWEQIYQKLNLSHIYDPVDLVFDGSNIVITANRYTNPGIQPAGLLIGQINPTSGALVSFMAVTDLDVSSNIITDFPVAAIEFINSEYVLVGSFSHPAVNSNHDVGYILKYGTTFSAGSTPFGTFEVTGADVELKGIAKGASSTEGFFAYDITASGSKRPGVFNLASIIFSTATIASNVYSVPDHQGSQGVFTIDNNNEFVLKNHNNLSPSGTSPTLNLVNDAIPLVPNSTICGTAVSLSRAPHTSNHVLEVMDISSEDLASDHELIVNDITGGTFNCFGIAGSSFKRGALAIEATSVEDIFEVYPNPSNGLFTLKMNENTREVFTKLEVHNVLGEKIAEFDIMEELKTIDLTKYSSGIYQLRLISEDGSETESKQIIIQ